MRQAKSVSLGDHSPSTKKRNTKQSLNASSADHCHQLFEKCATSQGLTTLLRAWDAASESRRTTLLSVFVKTFDGLSQASLDNAFADGASLFLTRLNTSLRLTYLLQNVNVALKIQAIRIFIEATGGKRFLVEFMEVGGALTLLEIIKTANLSKESPAKKQALEALQSIANAGPRFRDLLVESQTKSCISEYAASIENAEVKSLVENLSILLDAE